MGRKENLGGDMVVMGKPLSGQSPQKYAQQLQIDSPRLLRNKQANIPSIAAPPRRQTS